MKDEIKQALERVTQGKWECVDDLIQDGWLPRWIESGGKVIIDNLEMYEQDSQVWQEAAQTQTNFHLIANAPEWLRWQNERIDQLEKAMRDAIEEETNWNNPINALTCVISILEEALGKEE